MDNNWVITVGRQFCSGGAEIGHKIAKALDIPYYDREIIDEAAGLLKMSPEEIRKHDEKPPKLWDYPGYQYANYWYSDDPSLMLPISTAMRLRRAFQRHLCGFTVLLPSRQKRKGQNYSCLILLLSK